MALAIEEKEVGVVTSDVDLSHPPGEEAGKGRAVRPLRRYMSWVQNIVK